LQVEISSLVVLQSVVHFSDRALSAPSMART
jgi:hypothetical protein